LRAVLGRTPRRKHAVQIHPLDDLSAEYVLAKRAIGLLGEVFGAQIDQVGFDDLRTA